MAKAGVPKKAKGKKQKPLKQLTRKEQRKQKQEQKKQNKRLFFNGKKQSNVAATNNKVKRDVDNLIEQKAKPRKQVVNADDFSIEQLLSGNVDPNDDESISSDFSDAEVDALMPESLKQRQKQQKQDKQAATHKKVKVQIAPRPDATEVHRKDLQRAKELQNAARKNRVKQLRLENEEEDKEIVRLEKKLKLNKSKDKNRLVRKMFNDGLDYALEFCLDDDEERLKSELKNKQPNQNANNWSEEDDDDDEQENEMNIADSGEETYEEEEDDDSQMDDDQQQVEINKFTEDIYGRKRDQQGNIVADEIPQAVKYIPPHQRAMQESSAANGDAKQAQLMQNLRKNCKGLLNRLSEANLHKISVGMEELYMKNSRHNMNATLTGLMNEALIGSAMSNERMVQEHMVLLAYLHAHIGSEIGAHFLQTYIEQFQAFLADIQTLSVQDKRLNNLVLLLAYLYIFKIYEHRLLLEIINKLADNLSEKSIECLLLIFQSVGFKLRKDDPLAFKQMMLSVQKKIAEAPLEMKENLRLKFMVDILNAVKNNNIKKIPQFDPELAENLRKRLKAMLRNDKYVITLNIAMEDLLRADQVGKWWIVGSAWSGNVNDLSATTLQQNNAEQSAGVQLFSEKLQKLAKAQKMNTEERRNIFCIIMSAEDYVDAFEKILHLSLKDQRSIAYVILHCALNEKQSNPYYSHLALKFCNYNRKFQLAFQFACWDRINDIDALDKLQIKHLARFLEHLILNGGLNLSVLKVVDFLQLNKMSFILMKEIMLGMLLGDKQSELYEAFERVSKNPKLQQFKNSIRLFMQHFLLQQKSSKLKLSSEALTLLQQRADDVDKILAYIDL